MVVVSSSAGVGHRQGRTEARAWPAAACAQEPAAPGLSNSPAVSFEQRACWQCTTLFLSRVQGTVRVQIQALAAQSVPVCDKGMYGEVPALQREPETRLQRRSFATYWQLQKNKVGTVRDRERAVHNRGTLGEPRQKPVGTGRPAELKNVPKHPGSFLGEDVGLFSMAARPQGLAAARGRKDGAGLAADRGLLIPTEPQPPLPSPSGSTRHLSRNKNSPGTTRHTHAKASCRIIFPCKQC